MNKKGKIYVIPLANVIQIGYEKLLTESIGGGAGTAQPNPDGGIGDWARRKIFEYDFTFEDSSDPNSEESHGE